jgi:hypothetical protein
MGTSGALVLFLGIALLVVTGIYAISDLHVQIENTNDTVIKDQSDLAKSIENPIFMVFGYGVLIIAAIALISAYRSM